MWGFRFSIIKESLTTIYAGWCFLDFCKLFKIDKQFILRVLLIVNLIKQALFICFLFKNKYLTSSIVICFI
jgi:hypothetical protein